MPRRLAPLIFAVCASAAAALGESAAPSEQTPAAIASPTSGASALEPDLPPLAPAPSPQPAPLQTAATESTPSQSPTPEAPPAPAVVDPAQTAPEPLPAEEQPPVAQAPPEPAPDASPAASATPEQSVAVAQATPAPTPTPLPTPPPALMDLFRAVAASDINAVNKAIADGANPNEGLPYPAPADFAAAFKSSPLHYVVNVMRGVTPLMLAACIGDKKICAKLIESGANPNARAKPHGTTALWLAGYFHRGEVMQVLLGIAPGSVADSTTVEIDIAAQTARVLRGGTPGATMPVSTGRKGYSTPRGEFVITDKHQQWRSTIYGASMPYYMRLSCQAFGMHAGDLPGYPASHGCIRMRLADAKALFNELPVGTRVVIK